MENHRADSSWIVLDDTLSASSRPSSRSSDRDTFDWADQVGNEFLPFRRTPDGLKAGLELGLDGPDAFAQAERSLSLAVRLDGVDSDFVKRSTEYIEALQSKKSRNSATNEDHAFFHSVEELCASRSVSPRSESASPPTIRAYEKDGGGLFRSQQEENAVCAAATAAAEARGLKYGGRAPPVLGAYAPRVNILNDEHLAPETESSKSSWTEAGGQRRSCTCREMNGEIMQCHQCAKRSLFSKSRESKRDDDRLPLPPDSPQSRASVDFLFDDVSKVERQNKDERRRRRREYRARKMGQNLSHGNSSPRRICPVDKQENIKLSSWSQALLYPLVSSLGFNFSDVKHSFLNSIHYHIVLSHTGILAIGVLIGVQWRNNCDHMKNEVY